MQLRSRELCSTFFKAEYLNKLFGIVLQEICLLSFIIYLFNHLFILVLICEYLFPILSDDPILFYLFHCSFFFFFFSSLPLPYILKTVYVSQEQNLQIKLLVLPFRGRYESDYRTFSPPLPLSCIIKPPHSSLTWDSQVAQWLKNLPAMQETPADIGFIPGSGRSPGGRHGKPLQYSCLENPMDRGAWWATVHSVSKCQTRLKLLSVHRQALI